MAKRKNVIKRLDHDQRVTQRMIGVFFEKERLRTEQKIGRERMRQKKAERGRKREKEERKRDKERERPRKTKKERERQTKGTKTE